MMGMGSEIWFCMSLSLNGDILCIEQATLPSFRILQATRRHCSNLNFSIYRTKARSTSKSMEDSSKTKPVVLRTSRTEKISWTVNSDRPSKERLHEHGRGIKTRSQLLVMELWTSRRPQAARECCLGSVESLLLFANLKGEKMNLEKTVQTRYRKCALLVRMLLAVLKREGRARVLGCLEE